MRFIDRLTHAWQTQQSMLCVGLDPDPARFPEPLATLAKTDCHSAIETFCKGIVRATAPYCCAFKPQIAYFASQRAEPVLERLGRFVRDEFPNHIWLLDAKRGDIGSTAEHYAREAYDRYLADAVTVSPYMGTDSIAPYLQYDTRGIFVLCRTSNPGGDDFQMLSAGQHPLYLQVARRAQDVWNEHQQVGLVVGATYPKEISAVRSIAKTMPLLIPGIGAQGGDLNATVSSAKTDSGGMLINSARAVLYASTGADWEMASARVARQTRDDINAAF